MSQESKIEIKTSEAEHSKQNHNEVQGDNAQKHSEDNVLKEVLGELRDHREFTVFNKHLGELPVILFDEGGFKFYSGIHSMENSGDYLYEHHHIVNSKTHESPTLDLSITNLVAFQFIAALLLLIVFGKVRSSYKKRPLQAPKGMQNLLEVFVLIVRDHIVRPNIPSRKWADKLTPYFMTTFFFIYFLNMIGLVIPGGHTPTGNISITLGLAILAFLVINISQISKEGVGSYLTHLTAGAPWYLWPILVPIEVAGLVIKPGVLAIRLFANMLAGHTVLFTFIGLILLFKVSGIAFLSLSLFVYVLELLVAFLQAFIFCMLTAIFIGLGMHPDHEHAH